VAELIERDQELALLTEAIAEARAGSGGALLVEGEAGIGKTSLLSAARALARDAGVPALSARATSMESGIAFGLVRHLLVPTLLDAGDEERARLLRGAGALAEPALIGSDPTGGSPMETGFAAVHGVVWVVTALTEERGPLVLVADDVQWADAPSLRVLGALAAHAPDLPLLLVVAGRPAPEWDNADASAEVRARTRPLRPRRLTAPGVARVLTERLGCPAQERFAAAAHETTGGTPFLVTALAAALEREGILPLDEAASRVVALGAPEVEPRVTARLRELPPAAEPVARALAVLGDGRPASEVQALLADALTPEDVQAGAAALEAAGIVEGWPAPVFAHPLVRAAVLDGLEPAARTALHRLAGATAIAAGELERAAAHLHHVPGAGDPAAVDALLGAAAAATRRGSPEAALAQLRRALAEPPAPERRAEVLLGLGLAEMAVGLPEAAGRLRAAARAAAWPDMRLLAGTLSGHALAFGGRWTEGFEALDAAVAAAPDANPDALALARLETAASMLCCTSRTPEAVRLLAELEAAPAGGDGPLAPLTLGVLALRDAIVGAPREQVLARAAGAALGGAALAPLLTPAQAVPLAAMVFADAFDEVEDAAGQIVAGARTRGDVLTVCMVSAWHALSRWRRGALHEAEEALLAVDDAPGRPAAIGAILTETVHGLIAHERGDDDAAAARLDAPIEHDLEMADTPFCDAFLTARGVSLTARGRPAEALALLTEVGARVETAGSASVAASQWRMHAAIAAHAVGDQELALALATREVAEARAFGSPRALAEALWAQARATAGDAEARALLTEGVALLAGTPAAARRSPLLLDLGRRMAAAGETPIARDVLREALDEAWRHGAVRIATEAREALVAAGGRPRRPVRTGAEALTPSEARTARMAAAGATNRDIAQALFVTEKTVEAHLTASYRKLGIEGRGGLAAALAAT